MATLPQPPKVFAALRSSLLLGSASACLLLACGGAGDDVPTGSGGTGAAAGAGGASGNPKAGAAGMAVAGPVGGASGTGGQVTGTAGNASIAGAGGSGGEPATGGAAGQGGGAGRGGGGGSGSSCVPTKMWGTADPANAGPFQVMTEESVGPEAGIPDPKFENTLRRFNLYRPTDLSQGYCHPVITWANGTNDQPKTYEVLLKQLASHGFVVVASLNSQTAQGTPLPQIVGIDWMIEASNDPASPLYRRLDTGRIGATGHSQGGAATTMAGADPRITAIAPIAGSRENIALHGPAALLCGGMDDIVPCSRVKMAYDTIDDFPVMLANDLADTHGSWIGSIKNPIMVAATGWFRVHLMGDTANRKMFYGPSCTLCTDAQHWDIERKGMDQ